MMQTSHFLDGKTDAQSLAVDLGLARLGWNWVPTPTPCFPI